MPSSRAFALRPLEALRLVAGGETMSTPGAPGTPRIACSNFPRARPTGFYDGSEPPGLLGSGPSLAPVPYRRVFLMYTTLTCT
jgi:hypothetical protein